MLAANIYLFISNKKNNEEVTEVIKENEQLENKIDEYKQKQENISNTAREKYFNKLTKQAERFTDLIYTQKQEGYQSRRKKAKDIMSEKIFEMYYAPETYVKQDITSSVENKSFYIERMDMNQKEVDVLAEVEHKTEYSDTDKTKNTVLFLRISFIKEDNNWKANNTDIIYSEEQKTAESEV